MYVERGFLKLKCIHYAKKIFAVLSEMNEKHSQLN